MGTEWEAVAEGERNALLPTLPRKIHLLTDTHTLEHAVIYASHIGRLIVQLYVCLFGFMLSPMSNTMMTVLAVLCYTSLGRFAHIQLTICHAV